MRTFSTIILGCCLVVLAAPVHSQRQGDSKGRTLLAVFAHPDDETVVGPLLARYAREGASVYLAVATGGQRGVREHAGIPAGEAQARDEQLPRPALAARTRPHSRGCRSCAAVCAARRSGAASGSPARRDAVAGPEGPAYTRGVCRRGRWT